jgi:hypothetical protein
MAYSALALPILGKSKIEKIPPALENSPGEPALQPIPPKGLHRERLDRLMRGAGIDAILASTRNNIGYLTDMYLGMGDRFTAIQNYAIYAQGNDIISFVVYSGESGHLFRFKPDTDRSEATLDAHYTSLWPE